MVSMTSDSVRTAYYTRKSIAPITTSTILCPEDSLNKYNFTSVYFDSNVRYNRYDNSNDLYLGQVGSPLTLLQINTPTYQVMLTVLGIH